MIKFGGRQNSVLSVLTLKNHMEKYVRPAPSATSSLCNKYDEHPYSQRIRFPSIGHCIRPILHEGIFSSFLRSSFPNKSSYPKTAILYIKFDVSIWLTKYTVWATSTAKNCIRCCNEGNYNYYLKFFFRYYQIVQFKLNGTLVTPLSLYYDFII